MDLNLSPEETAFRDEVRAFIKAELPAEVQRKIILGQELAKQDIVDWQRKLNAKGWAVPHWPVEYGGKDWGPMQEFILMDEIQQAPAPYSLAFNISMVGPVIAAFGSEAQKQKFLAPTANLDIWWCQGFSEPGAGSDLASLSTTAVLDGDSYVINGHKVWTSYSDVADWCLLLARTDPVAPRHRGISGFIVSMHQPGVQQRPLTMISGVSTEFGQVLFDGARVPAANLVGALGEGWKLAMTIVAHEREPSTLGFTARYGKTVRKLAAQVAAAGGGSPAELAWAHVQTEMLYAHVRRRLSEQLDGVTHGSDGSLDKLLMTWTEQAVGQAALAVAGPGDAEALEVYLYSRAQSVMGGTSQIQKNIIASRILGLG